MHINWQIVHKTKNGLYFKAISNTAHCLNFLIDSSMLCIQSIWAHREEQ